MKSASSYKLAGGRRGILVREDTSLSGWEFLVCVDINDTGELAKIHRAIGIHEKDLRESFKHYIKTEELCIWDEKTSRLLSRRQETLFELILSSKEISLPEQSASLLAGAFLQRNRWSPECENFLNRVKLLRETGMDMPDLSEDRLKQTDWLEIFINGKSLPDDATVLKALQSLLTYEQNLILNREAPEYLIIPSGRKVQIIYENEQTIISAKLQELFGLSDTPTIAGGQRKLTIHLLSPSGKPVQITKDLKNFWEKTYFEVRKELKGRYPRHPWPDDPATSLATAKTKKAMERKS
jgi:ATP-dependent helicase HrpB